MATIDLGKIKLVWRGTYAGGTAYTVDDVVQHTDNGLTSSFICTTNSTGNAPSTGGSVHGSWAYLAKGGVAGTDVGTTITTQGDILYRDGSGLQRLAKPASNKILQNTSGGVLSWVDDGGASIVSTVSATSGDYGNQATLDPLAVTITPKSTSSKILIMVSAHGEFSNGGWDCAVELRRAISGGATTDLIDALQTGGDRNGFVAPYTIYGEGDNDSTPEGFKLMVVDTPNTTSACEYKIVFQQSGSFKLNRTIGSGAQEKFASTAVAIDFGG